MVKIFENISRLTTRHEYDTLRVYTENLLDEATKGGFLNEPEADNEYVRELGRLYRLGALYEDEFMDFSLITPTKKRVVQPGQIRMVRRRMKQKDVIFE